MHQVLGIWTLVLAVDPVVACETALALLAMVWEHLKILSYTVTPGENSILGVCISSHKVQHSVGEKKKYKFGCIGEGS